LALLEAAESCEPVIQPQTASQTNRFNMNYLVGQVIFSFAFTFISINFSFSFSFLFSFFFFLFQLFFSSKQ